MRLPRMTTRRWMIAVAVAAMLLGTKAGLDRRRRALAEHYERMAEDFTQWIRDRRYSGCKEEEILPIPVRERRTVLEDAEDQELMRKHLDYFRAFKTKYEYAIRHPWLPVWPDPPEPK